MTVAAEHLDTAALDVVASKGYWQRVFNRLTSDRVAMVAAAILLLILFAALLAPYIVADPYKGSMIRRLKPIGTPGFLLGSDELGRDMLSRLIHGGRLSLMMGVSPVVAAFVIGSFIGILAGYVGGWLNM